MKYSWVQIVGATTVVISVTAVLLVSSCKKTEAPPPPLVTGTIDGIYWNGTKPYPKGMDSLPLNDADIAVSIKESYSDKSQQPVHDFLKQATHDFTLKSAGNPDLKVHLSDTVINSEWAHYEGVSGTIDSADKNKVVKGATYTIEPVGDATKSVHWSVDPTITVTAP